MSPIAACPPSLLRAGELAESRLMRRTSIPRCAIEVVREHYERWITITLLRTGAYAAATKRRRALSNAVASAVSP